MKMILNVVNEVIKNNFECKLKGLWIVNMNGEKIYYYEVMIECDEVEFVIWEIMKY